MFCEKPVGGTPEATLRVAAAVRRAGVISGVGYNYRWVPLVLHARDLIAAGRLGEITNYRGRFFTMYGNDPLGLLSWRFLQHEAGYGVSSDILSHVVDLATMLVGPITKVFGTNETFIRQRPVPQTVGFGAHYARGRPEDPMGEVTNEDYAGALVVFAGGARGTFECSRSMIGPESQMAFDVYGTEGRDRVEPGEAQRAAGVPRGRGWPGAPWVHHGVRRRPLPVPRPLRARRRQQHRLRGRDHDRGLRLPGLGRQG